jgi:hypothetical protein
MKPSSKITKAKRAGGMAQVVVHLPREVLSSNPHTKKKKKKTSVNTHTYHGLGLGIHSVMFN